MDEEVTFTASVQSVPWQQAKLLPGFCLFSTMLGNSSGESTFLLSLPHD